MKIPVQLIGKRSTRHAVIQTEQEVENAKNRQEVQRAPRLRLTLVPLWRSSDNQCIEF